MKKSILLIFTTSLIIFSGCKSGRGSDPKTVLNHFFDALSNKNIDEAKKYVTKDSEGMMDMVEMGMKNIPDSAGNAMYNKENMEMGNDIISGDRATVPIKDKKSGEETDFVLKKEDGEWKVAFDKSTLMEMAQKKMKEHGINGMGELKNGMDENMDSLQNHLKNISKEDMQHAQKMMDSAKKVLNEMQKNAK
ncbi:MAG: DUF4878 domain-containing protein [Bacteroidota bacterium]|nr:DUF4878 domain-containing protein [Bacteroidota bacterium]